MNPSQKICMYPFEKVELNFNGKMHFCCSSWQKTPFGDFNNKTILEEWNSKKAKEIRASILDGSYRFCNKDVCPHLLSGNLKSFSELNQNQKDLILSQSVVVDEPPSTLMLNYDQSCNLSCESCRKEKINYSVDSSKYKTLKEMTDKFTSDFFSHSSNRVLHLNITGSGDPFASVVFRQFLENLDGSQFPNLVIDLQTNGVLLTERMWERLHKIHKNIGQILVSIDAAEEATYLVVRRGGHWQQLLSNMEFLQGLRQKNLLSFLQVNFVVQKRNFHEMEAFVKLFDREFIDIINFSLIDDWISWTRSVFNEHAVWKKDNKDHQNFLTVLTNKCFDNPKVNLGNLTKLRKEALDAAFRNLPVSKRVGIILKDFLEKYYIKFYRLGPLFIKIVTGKKKIRISI